MVTITPALPAFPGDVRKRGLPVMASVYLENSSAAWRSSQVLPATHSTFCATLSSETAGWDEYAIDMTAKAEIAARLRQRIVISPPAGSFEPSCLAG